MNTHSLCFLFLLDDDDDAGGGDDGDAKADEYDDNDEIDQTYQDARR